MQKKINKVKIAQIQTHINQSRQKNLENMEEKLERVMQQRPDIVTFGEMITCPYATGNFPIYAEKEGEESWQTFQRLARKYHIYLSAGTIPEVDKDGRVYNTAYVFDREGNQIAKHRKVHLFDIAVSGGQRFRESETLTPGDKFTVFDTEFGKMGICICFDLRFPELSRLMVDAGANVIFVPAAFNLTTGPAHWETLFRSRALDNQCYMVGTSDARDVTADYISWGHSILVSPWGDIIAQMNEEENFMVHEIDLEYVTKVRKELPLLSARRLDIY